MRKLSQRRTDFHRHSVRGRSQRVEFRFVVSIMVQRANSLDDERRQQLSFLFFVNTAVNSRSKDHGDVSGRDTGLNETANKQIDDLSTGGRARRVRQDQEYRIVAAHNVV